MFNIDSLIQGGGLLLIGLIVFSESGLLIGFFLPGDTLLFGAGLAASQGKLSILWLLLTVVTAAIVGDNVGYSIGKRAGKKIFNKKDGIFFKSEYLTRSEKFYESHGGKTIVFARFTPVVRTFAPVVAGASNMSHRKFFLYNVIGGIAWGAGMPLLGYYVGDKIPGIEHTIGYIIIGVILLSILPALWHAFKEKSTRTIVLRKLKNIITRTKA